MSHDDEIQTRTCRACGGGFQYPVPRSPATRFHCATCALLPEETRATFEKLTKRVRDLERRLAPPATSRKNG